MPITTSRRALLQSRQDCTVLGRRAEARQHLDADRIAFEAGLEGLEVLLREHRRRHEDGHLLAREHGEEGRAHRHLGLAEADVAAHQPVHRPPAPQVGEHVVDGPLPGPGVSSNGKRAANSW